MSGRAILDANVLVALLDSRDKWHRTANRLVDAAKAADIRVAYLDIVLSETIGVLTQRAEERKRTDQLPMLLDALEQQVPTSIITWASMNLGALYDDALRLVRQTSGKLNFNDAVIALMCRDLQVTMLISLDRDFDSVEWIKRIATPEDFASVE